MNPDRAFAPLGPCEDYEFDLVESIDGAAAPERRAMVEHHLQTCGRCRAFQRAMIGVNVDTLAVDYNIDIPNYVHGVSIDFYGYVWGVTQGQPFAYRVDPATEEIETFTGLVGPYTYSDMTGFALSQAGGPAG